MVPIDSSHTTSYRLSIVTFALGRTVWPQYIRSPSTPTTDRRTQHCSISATVSRLRSAKTEFYSVPGIFREFFRWWVALVRCSIGSCLGLVSGSCAGTVCCCRLLLPCLVRCLAGCQSVTVSQSGCHLVRWWVCCGVGRSKVMAIVCRRYWHRASLRTKAVAML